MTREVEVVSSRVGGSYGCPVRITYESRTRVIYKYAGDKGWATFYKEKGTMGLVCADKWYYEYLRLHGKQFRYLPDALRWLVGK